MACHSKLFLSLEEDVNKKLFTVLLLLVFLLAACTANQNTNTVETNQQENTTNVVENNQADADNNAEANDVVEDTETDSEADADAADQDAEAAAPMEFVDGLGRTVVLEAYPETVITISASTTEIVFAIGAGDLVIARDTYSIYPAEVEAIEIIGDFFGTVPSEALLAAEPDLVLAGGIISEDQINTMEELGLTVYYQLDPVDFQGLFDNINAIGELLGYQDSAAALTESLAGRVDAVIAALADVEEKPVVFVELDGSDPASPWTTGSGTFVDYILSTGGGTNAAAELTGAYAQMSIEALIAANPEVILLTDALYGVTVESVAERAGWDAIAAVQNDGVFPFDPYLFNVPGPRLVDGLEEVARLLHPDLFE
jgi:iron complex transport system substrate-binding protein